MEEIGMLVFVIAYTAFAIYAGYKVISGRSEWLEKKEPLNRIVKFIVCFAVGYVIAVFYLFFLILKMLGLITKWLSF